MPSRGNRNPGTGRTQRWGSTLTLEQRASVKEIRRANDGDFNPANHASAPEGWRVYIQPTTGPAKYLELRHYLIGGQVARWVIERDGTVTSHNHRGQLQELVAV